MGGGSEPFATATASASLTPAQAAKWHSTGLLGVYGGVSQRGTLFGVPIIRTIVYWGPLILGKCHIGVI